MKRDHVPVEVNLRPSFIMLYWIVAIHFFSSLTVYCLSLVFPLVLALQLFIIISFIRGYRSWKKPYWVKIATTPMGWSIEGSGNNHQVLIAVELERYLQIGSLWLVDFRPINTRSKQLITITLLPDCCDGDALRQFKQSMLV